MSELKLTAMKSCSGSVDLSGATGHSSRGGDSAHTAGSFRAVPEGSVKCDNNRVFFFF